MKSDLTKHTLLQTVVLFFALASVFLFSGTIMPRQTVTLTGYTPLMVSIVTFVDTIPWLAMGLSLLLTTINAFFLTRITVRFLSFSDKNYYIFAVSNGIQVRILAAKLKYNKKISRHILKKAAISEAFISVREMEEIAKALSVD